MGDWTRQRFSIGQASVKPIGHGGLSQIEMFTPFGQREGASAQRHQPVVPFVAALLERCCPDAVLRAIGAIVVLTFEFVTSRWTWPHVSQEVGEVQPPLTHCDSSSAVVLVTTVRPIGAPLLHHLPDGELWRAGPTVRSDALTMQASTGESGTSAKRVTEDVLDGSAFAPALPYRLTVGCGSYTGKDCETAEYLAGQIDKRRHGLIIQDNVVY